MKKYHEYRIYNDSTDAFKVKRFLEKMEYHDFHFRQRPEDKAFVIRTTRKGIELINKLEAFSKEIDMEIKSEQKPS